MIKSVEKENKIFINIGFDPQDDADPQELERITYNLRDDLTGVDAIEKVDLISKKEKAPQGAKAGSDMVMLGSLLVTLAASAANSIIPNLASTLQSWLTRHERSKISLEIGGDKLEVSGISNKEQKRLIDTWISRHIEKKEELK